MDDTSKTRGNKYLNVETCLIVVYHPYQNLWLRACAGELGILRIIKFHFH